MTNAVSMEGGAARRTVAPAYAEALRVWTRIGLLSFGGPTGQIALMHKMLVEDKKWIDEGRFLNALNFCMLLPGPEAMQLATYIGWRLHGVKGGLTAGLLFVLPGAFVILGLSMIYALFGSVPAIEALFSGIKAAVLIIVIEALLRVAKRALKTPEHWMLAAASFVALFFFALPYPLIVATAAALGYLMASRDADRPGAEAVSAHVVGVPLRRTLATALVWGLIWFLPLAALMMILGRDHVIVQSGVFFSKLAVVTFGGAYAVLAYMAQDAVATYHWLSAGEMMDGLGLAETTPGPLILVTEFVGFLAGYRHGGGGASMALGMLGAIVTLWVTFVPCFLWVFTGAPYVEWLNGQPKLKGALSGVSAAVVGVILNLGVWFALNVFFANQVTVATWGPFRVSLPTLAALDWRIVALSLIAGLMVLRLHVGVIRTLAVSGTIALMIQWLGL